MKHTVFSGVDTLPYGKAAGGITDGCMVLEGGAFRGVYTSGVLDCLMENGINMAVTVGVSAGAMNGMNYVSGQIGRSGRINLLYRRDSNYVGLKAIKHNKGIIGFDYIFHDLPGVDSLDREEFYDKKRKFYAVATDCITGQTTYFDRDTCSDIFQAVRASASMPYVSKTVKIDGRPYLDGGCSCKIPYKWALENNFDKIVLVRTRHPDFRKEVSDSHKSEKFYHKYPAFAKKLDSSNADYNKQCDEIAQMSESGRIFVISPSQSVTIGRLEKDMEKLGALYYLGYNDAKNSLPGLKVYLGIK